MGMWRGWVSSWCNSHVGRRAIDVRRRDPASEIVCQDSRGDVTRRSARGARGGEVTQERAVQAGAGAREAEDSRGDRGGRQEAEYKRRKTKPGGLRIASTCLSRRLRIYRKSFQIHIKNKTVRLSAHPPSLWRTRSSRPAGEPARPREWHVVKVSV